MDELEGEPASHHQQEERHLKQLRSINSALRKCEERYRDIFENVSDLLFSHDLEGNFTDTNLGFISEYGYSEGELINRNIRELVHEKYVDEVNQYLARIKQNGADDGLMTVLTKDGRKRVLEYKNTLVYCNTKPSGVRGCARDITERTRAEAALRASEARYRSIVNAFDGMICVCNRENRIEFMNDRFIEFLGQNPTGKRCDDILERLNYQCPWNYDEKVFLGETTRKEMQAFGNNRWYYVVNSPICYTDGNMSKQMMILDITKRKAAEEELKREKNKFEALVEESPFGVALISNRGAYLYLNPKFTEIFGYTLEDIPDGRQWFQNAYPDRKYREWVISTWLQDLKDAPSGPVNPRTFDVSCKNGLKKVIHSRMVRLESNQQIVIHEDITEKQQLETQLIQAQKMEAVGVLAGGITHDFNNILYAIMVSTELSLRYVPDSSKAKKNLQRVLDASRRAKDLVRQILTFSRKDELKKGSSTICVLGF